MRALTFSVMLSVFCSCTHVDALIVSGEAAVSVGEQFLLVSKAMEQAAFAGAITKEQYTAWAKFGEKFQAAYAISGRLWALAKQTNDRKLQEQALATVSALIPELLHFARLLSVPEVIVK